jgi:phage shock protein PspC (stress-responsive transcriptional regulator)
MRALLASGTDGRSLLAQRGQRRPGSSRTMRTHLRTSLVLIAVLLLGLPAAAHANGNAVIRDCADDGQLSKNYSQKDLQDAYNNLPSDIDEYTDCRAVIRAAMGGGSGSTGSPPPNGIVTPSGAIAGSPADVAALNTLTARAAKGKRPAVSIGGQKILPGNAGLSGVFGGLAGSSGMPSSLVAAIVALLILAVVTAYLAAREKFPVVRRVALRVLGR